MKIPIEQHPQSGKAMILPLLYIAISTSAPCSRSHDANGEILFQRCGRTRRQFDNGGSFLPTWWVRSSCRKGRKKESTWRPCRLSLCGLLAKLLWWRSLA